MKIEMDDCRFEKIDTIFSVPADTDLSVEMRRTTAIDIGTFLDVQEPATLLGKLGFKEDTPARDIIKLLKYLRQHPSPSPELAQERLNSRGLTKHLGAGVDIATIGTWLYQLSISPAATEVIDSLSQML